LATQEQHLRVIPGVAKHKPADTAESIHSTDNHCFKVIGQQMLFGVENRRHTDEKGGEREEGEDSKDS